MHRVAILIGAICLILPAALLGKPASSRCLPAEAELRELHERARRAHLQGDVALMAGDWSDQVVSASGGDLITSDKAGLTRFFATYFGQVKYLEWRDVAPPALSVSPDGRMAWMAVKVEARFLSRAESAKGEQRFKSSWIATYRREGCQWKMTGVSSAVVNKP